MRVVFLTWRDSGHPDGGGSEVYVEQVARHLVRRGHEVTLVSAGYPGASSHQRRLDGVEVVRLGGRLSVYPRALAWLARRSSGVDVVVDVINGLPFGTPLVRRRGIVALVHHVHERQWHIIYPGLRGRMGWWIESRLTPLLYRRVPHLTVSESSRADLQRLGIPTPVVARNGLAVTAVDRPRAASPRLVVLARLVPHKRIEQAVDVAVALAPRFPGLRLDIVGEGWWRPALEEYVAARDAGDVVHLHGRVSDGDRDDLLAEAWVPLLPSVKEGWGLAVLEAAAQGTPTIAYREAGGVTESVLDGVTGVLVESEGELGEATARLLEDPSQRDRLGAAARARAGEFDWGATTDVVEEVLRAAARTGPAQRSP
jgi:glycosyltransferase involved in cell wall biosynthesis